jgi:hypothetical protein
MTDQENNLPDGMGIMNNIDQMAFLVAEWFENAHKQAQMAYEVPDGQPITVTFEKDGKAEELVLTGDLLKGFKAGCIVLMNIFGQLPFARVQEPAPTTEAPDLKLVQSNDEPASGN